MAVLFTWIDRGEVNRRSANQFYSVIQLANSHVRRLMSEKAQHDEAMERAKEEFKHALQAILAQCKYTSWFVFFFSYGTRYPLAPHQHFRKKNESVSCQLEELFVL